MKDVILVVVILISIALSVMVVRFNEKATKATKSLEEERYSRMVAEETLQKNAAKIASYESQIKSASDKMNKVQDILDQEKNVNSDLKKQYDALVDKKAELEQKLQEAINQAASLQAAAQAAPVTNEQSAASVPATP